MKLSKGFKKSFLVYLSVMASFVLAHDFYMVVNDEPVKCVLVEESR